MSHITYHYLYNGDQLQGNYLYDINHLPDKKLQEKLYQRYIDDVESRLKVNKSGKELLPILQSKKTLKEKANFYFELVYERAGKVLGKPYFGVYGIYTTPADLFDPNIQLKTDSAPLKYRLAFDCDTIDPKVIIIRMGADCYPYNESNWDKFCKPFVDDPKMTSKMYNKYKTRKFRVVPQVVIYLPKLKFNKSQLEEAIPQ